MIGRDQLAEAARYADAQTEELGSLEAYCAQRGIDVAGLVYIAEQRALRIGMLMDGQDPTKFPRKEFTPVHLPPHIKGLLPYLMTTWIDGLATGVVAKEASNGS